MEDEETLKASAVVGGTADLVEDLVDHLLAYGVVATGVVVRGILTAGDHVLGVEKAAVGTGADLVDDIGLEITVDGTRDIFALAFVGSTVSDHLESSHGSYRHTSLREEGAEAVVGVSLLTFLGQVTIGL